MEEQKFQKEFKLLLAAGDSKLSSISAIEAAKEFDFDRANLLMREGEKQMSSAHMCEKDLITEEARGVDSKYGVLMMHAQDHLTTAIIFNEMANQLIKLYKIIYELEKEINDIKTALQKKGG